MGYYKTEEKPKSMMYCYENKNLDNMEKIVEWFLKNAKKEEIEIIGCSIKTLDEYDNDMVEKLCVSEEFTKLYREDYENMWAEVVELTLRINKHQVFVAIDIRDGEEKILLVLPKKDDFYKSVDEIAEILEIA